jgi:hypothetical protein
MMVAHRNHVWTWDFIADATVRGGQLQLFPVQTFVPEPSVKALHKAILSRAAWFNVDRLDPVLLQSPLHDLRNELRAVVAPQILRCPVLFYGLAASAYDERFLS